jgi:acetyl-CoA carboxylase biotin carboxyl carrier protein
VNQLVALISGDELRAPAPGWFRRRVAADHLVAPGDVIGELEILGRVVEIVAPNVRGLAKLAPESAARRAVGHGELLLHVVAGGTIGAAIATEAAPRTADHGLVFRAPTSGRYYGRPTPDKPAFVELGAELHPGSTICLLEVMKTFNRVTYHGAPARVKEVLVADGADVNSGDPLLALEAL